MAVVLGGTGVAVGTALCGGVVGTMAVSVWLRVPPTLAVGAAAGGVIRLQASIVIIRIRTADRMGRRFGFMGVSPLETG
jgi:hypothetical protein